MYFEAKKAGQFLNLVIVLKMLEKWRVIIGCLFKAIVKNVLCLGNFWTVWF